MGKRTKKTTVMVQDIEFVSVSVEKSKKGARLILSFRLDPENDPSVVNVGLSSSQSVRLWRDICMVMSNNESISKEIEKHKDNILEFDAAVNGFTYCPPKDKDENKSESV